METCSLGTQNNSLINESFALGNFTLTPSSTVEKVVSEIFWTIAMVFDPAVDFFTQSLSDAIGLETYRHGTNYSSYLSIRHEGFDPSKGGTGASAAVDLDLHSQGKVHFSSDSETKWSFAKEDMQDDNLVKIFNFILFPFAVFNTRIFNSRYYCFVNSLNTGRKNPWCPRVVRWIQAGAQAIFIPTIKIRMLPSERDVLKNMNGTKVYGKELCFESDPDMTIPNTCTLMAYRTNLGVGTDYIGMKGIFKQGVKGSVFKRIKAHPVKATWGIVKLINPIGIPLLLAFGIAYAVHA